MKTYTLFMVVALLIFWQPLFSQSDTQERALLLIDLQEFYFEGGVSPLSEADEAVGRAAILLDHFRKNNGLIIHVKHDFSPGGDIHKAVSPLSHEKVITKKEVNAFINTDLEYFLRHHEKRELVVAGMQTHMCVEAAVRAAKDLGFACTVISDACATRDLTINGKTVSAENVHLSTLATLNRTYARVMSLEDFLKVIEN